MQEADLYQQAEEAVNRCLRSVPFIAPTMQAMRESVLKGARPDLVVRFQVCGDDCQPREWLLIAEVKSSGQPRIARQASANLHHSLRRYHEDNDHSPILVFIAPFISQEAAAVCTEEGVNYIDLAGNCHLSFGTVYIERQGNPNPYKREKNRSGLYAPKAERVLRVLLQRPRQSWHVRELAKAASVSLGTAVDAKKMLFDAEWVRTDRDGIRLVRPDALLADWASRYDFSRSKAREFYSLKPLAETEAAIAAACRHQGVRYAFTGFSGAARYAAFVRYNRASLYVDGDIDAVAATAKLKEVTSGANVALIAPYDAGVFISSELVNGDTVASPVQIYLDLQHVRARGEEAAEHLYQQKIQPAWGGEIEHDA